MGEWEPFSREKYLICHQKWCVMCRKFHNRFPHCFAINFATHLTRFESPRSSTINVIYQVVMFQHIDNILTDSNMLEVYDYRYAMSWSSQQLWPRGFADP